MSRTLDDLSPRFLPLALQLLGRAIEAKIPVLITATGRTAAEQAEAVRTGHSKVAHSKHQDGNAIDIVPWAVFQLHGEDKLQWDTLDPVWPALGAIGEALGLRWGGRFEPLNAAGVGWDPGHFELPTTSPGTLRRA